MTALALRQRVPVARLKAPAPFSIDTDDPLSRSSRELPPRIVTDPAETPDDLKRSVMLLGNFDCFHRGHQALLAVAKSYSARANLPLGIMSVEPHPRQLFEPQSLPFRLSTHTTKRETLARMGIDFIFSPVFDRRFAGQDATTFVADVLHAGLNVAHVVFGHDFRFGARRSGDGDLLRLMGDELGFGVSVVGNIHHRDMTCSASHVRDLIRAGDIAAANDFLEYRWSVEIGLLHRGARDSDCWSVDWPDSVLRPAPGRYAVVLRCIGGVHPTASGELVIDETDKLFFTFEKGHVSLTDASAASPLIVEFLGNASRSPS